MGMLKHREEAQKERLDKYLNLPERDLRSCYYHIGRTTTKSVFFISDAVPITDKYVERGHNGANDEHFVIKNPKLNAELERKLRRILSVENSSPNYFRRHITSVKEYLVSELNSETNAE